MLRKSKRDNFNEINELLKNGAAIAGLTHLDDPSQNQQSFWN